jgi:hypothetical protein
MLGWIEMNPTTSKQDLAQEAERRIEGGTEDDGRGAR